MPESFRQEVLNVILAQLLQERGVISAPESIITMGEERARRIPDVIVSYRGLRTAIEGEIAYRKSARELALKTAQTRVEENIAHIGVAVVYPEALRDVDFKRLKTTMSECDFEIAVVTEAGATDFVKGNIGYLESALRQAFQQLVQEDVVAQAVAILDSGIERFATVMVTSQGDMGRIADALGIQALSDPICDSDEEAD